MSKHYRVLLIAAGLALGCAGPTYADGDGGDNSMSQWTGESYAAFQRRELGDFHKETRSMAGNDKPADKARTNLATAPEERAVRKIRSPFRDDTAG